MGGTSRRAGELGGTSRRAGELCAAIFADIKSVILTVEGLTVLREEGRKLCRFLKRTEVLISDVAPYLPRDDECPSDVWLPLKEVYDTLHDDIRMLLVEISTKGALATYLEAEPLLKRFQLATLRLHDAIAHLPLAEIGVPEETRDEMGTVQVLLSKARFDLTPAHGDLLQRYHAACDGVDEHAKAMVACTSEVIQAISGAPQFTREGFAAATQELFKEVGVLSRGADGDANRRMVRYMRMYIEAMRLHHVSGDDAVPVEYLCPLTYQLMDDPAVLADSGHTFERSSIEAWVAKGNRFCPRTGQKLGWGKLNLVPNLALKDAIRRWREHGHLSLNFQPLLRTIQDCDKAVQDQTATPEMPPVATAHANYSAAEQNAAGHEHAAPAAAAPSVAAATAAAAAAADEDEDDAADSPTAVNERTPESESGVDMPATPPDDAAAAEGQAGDSEHDGSVCSTEADPIVPEPEPQPTPQPCPPPALDPPVGMAGALATAAHTEVLHPTQPTWEVAGNGDAADDGMRYSDPCDTPDAEAQPLRQAQVVPSATSSDGDNQEDDAALLLKEAAGSSPHAVLVQADAWGGRE